MAPLARTATEIDTRPDLLIRSVSLFSIVLQSNHDPIEPRTRFSKSRSLAEDGGADAHVRRPHSDGGRKIGAHAHRQKLEPVARRDLGGEREMRPGRLVERRNAHK